MALTATQSKSMYQFFALAFNAAPGVTYMNQLDAALNSGMSVTQVVEAFTAKAEFTSTYPNFLSNAAFATKFINSNVGSYASDAAKAAAIADVTAALNAGWSRGKTITQVFTNINALSETDATWGTFVKVINNEVAYAQYYTETLLGGAEATPNLAALRAVIANVTPTTSITDAAIAAVLNPAPVPVAQTFTLTTSVDTVTGSSGNDTINAALASTAATSTLNSFDSVGGGAGIDTLNLAAAQGSNFTLPAGVTFSGLENVNISQVAGGGTGTGALTVTNSTFGSGIQKFSYIDASVAADMTAAAVSVTLASATDVTVSATGTGTFTTVAVTDTSTTAASTGSGLKNVSITKASGANTLTGNGISTVALNAAGGLTTVTAAAGARALTVNASGTTTQGGLTDAQATTATLNVSGAQTFGTLTVAKAGTVTVNTTAAATTAVVAATATTLNLGGTALNTLTAANTNAALTSVVITGSGGVSSDLSAIATLATVDTTGSTAAAPASGTATGANTLTLGINTALTGGAGQDVISVGATTKAIALGDGNDTAVVSVTALGAGGTIDGGAGTNTLRLANADAVTLSTSGATQTAFRAAVTNFQTLDITTQTGSIVSLTGAGTFTGVRFVSAAAAQVFTNASSGLTITDVYGAAGTSVTTNNLSGAADSMTVVLTGDLSTAARVFGTFALPGVETVNITTTDTTASPTAQLATLTLTDAQATTISISGNNGLALTHTGTALVTLNASGVTRGGVTLTSGVLTTDAVVTGSTSGGDTFNFSASVAKVTITETAGTNSITGSATIASTLTGGSGADTIVGGAAADTISAGAGSTTNTITGAAGADSINLTGALGVNTLIYGVASQNVSATGANVDSITNFKSGIDKLQLTAGDNSASATTVAAGGLAGINLAAGSTLATMGSVITDTTSVATIANVYTQLALDLNNTTNAFAASATGAGNVVGRVVTFTNGAAAGSYLVINDVTAAFQAATDMVVKLVGTTTFTAGDLTVV